MFYDEDTKAHILERVINILELVLLPSHQQTPARLNRISPVNAVRREEEQEDCVFTVCVLLLSLFQPGAFADRLQVIFEKANESKEVPPVTRGIVIIGRSCVFSVLPPNSSSECRKLLPQISC